MKYLILCLVLTSCAAPPPVKIAAKIAAKSLLKKKPQYCGVDYDNPPKPVPPVVGTWVMGNYYPPINFDPPCNPYIIVQ